MVAGTGGGGGEAAPVAKGKQVTMPDDPSVADAPLAAVRWPVRTARLLLRPATSGDVEATWTFRQLDSVSHWLTSAPATVEEYRAVFEHPPRLAKTLVVELDGVVIGDLMIAVEDAWAQAEVAEQARGVQAELGWVFHPDYTGRGYATEAVRELVRICFTGLGLRRVTANCFAGNEASWRLMERVGMRRELYTVRESLHRSGQWLDGLGYALLAEEWQQATTAPGSSGQSPS
jgi:RimJ/RimL family protein N-acetyltransferase